MSCIFSAEQPTIFPYGTNPSVDAIWVKNTVKVGMPCKC